MERLVQIAKAEKDNIGVRLKALRLTLNINRDKLSDALFISEGSIRDIEEGKAASIDNTVKLSYFFGFTLSEICSPAYQRPPEATLRAHIKAFHKKHKIPDSEKLLEIRPKAYTVIKERLLPDGRFDKPIYVRKIASYCKTDYQLVYSSSTISKAMKSLVAEKLIRIANPKEKNHQYIKVKK